MAAPIRPEDSAAAFRAHLIKNGIDHKRATLIEMVDAMLGFFRAVPGQYLDHEDGDGLLFEHGHFRTEDAATYDVCLTRQFIQRVEGEQVISQLQWRARFATAPSLAAMKPLALWSWDVKDLDAFRAAIVASEGFRVASKLARVAMIIDWSPT